MGLQFSMAHEDASQQHVKTLKRGALVVVAVALLAALVLVLAALDVPMVKEDTGGTALLTGLDSAVNHPSQHILLARLNERLQTQMLVKLGKADYKNRKAGSEKMMHAKSLYATPGGLAGGPTAEEWTDANWFGGWQHEADLVAMGAVRGSGSTDRKIGA